MTSYVKLSEIAQGKDNNFNLLRFLAAFAVLISHSFSLATGLSDAEPLRATYGLTWGDIAVDVFFVTSGFLVTASLMKRQSAIAFVWARALRIFPALWLMLILTVFGMGMALTTYTPHAYVTAYQTWRYLLKNAALFHGIEFDLPGLFASNPWKGGVNGSLWSLHPEIQMYAILLGLWIACAFVRTRRLLALEWSVIAIAAIAGALYFSHGTFDNPVDEFPRLAFMFFTGASLYVLKDRITLHRTVFLALLGLTLLSALTHTAFFFTLSLSLPYLALYTAYGFRGRALAFNRCGDYSYGIYIYAFAVQQGIASLVPGISVGALMTLSALITLALAMLSWHVLEKRALGLKEICAERTAAFIRGAISFRPGTADEG